MHFFQSLIDLCELMKIVLLDFSKMLSIKHSTLLCEDFKNADGENVEKEEVDNIKI